jgi:hypothetical protein
MRLVVRFIRFLVLSIMNIMWILIALIFRLLFLPLLLLAFRAMRDLIFLSFTATVNGPYQYTDRVASDWTRRFLEMGAPRDHMDSIYFVCQMAVGSLIALGWVVSVLFTVEIIRIVFGYFI